MENQLLDNQSHEIEQEIKSKIIITSFIALNIITLICCFYIFRNPPSIKYSFVLYAVALMLISAIITTIFTKNRSMKLYSILITFGTPITTFLAGVFDTFYLNARIGQTVTWVLIILNLILIFSIWSKFSMKQAN